MGELVGSILLGAEDVVVPYIKSRVPYTESGFGPCVAFGVVRRGQLIGGVVYYNYRPDDGDIMVVVAFDRPDWCLPQTLRALFDYPFNYLGCGRMTAAIARKNKRSRKLTEGLGFKLEGVARRAFGREDDAVLYGLLRDECRFLRNNDGQKKLSISAAAA
jgi:RimJ/RimL family protein N-acetyltransferase